MKKILACLFAFAIGFVPTVWAQNKWELREDDNTFDVSIDASNVIQGATINGNASTATSLAANGANCSAGNYPLGVDASGAVESCTADDDSPDSDAEVPDAITVSGGSVSSSDVTLQQSATPAPTAEGRIEWDTDDDRIVVGDGSGQATFYSGPHTAGHGDGSNCSAGQGAGGVDANGAAQDCTDYADVSGDTMTGQLQTSAGTEALPGLGIGDTDTGFSQAGTNQIGVSANAVTVATFSASGLDADGYTEAGSNTLSNDISGNAGTSTALAANGANCSAGNYPLGVDASGAAESCTADDDSPDDDSEVPDDITIGSGGSVNDAALSANVSLLGSSISVGETDFIELKDTKANICADVPSATAMLAIATDTFDMYLSTGTGAGDYRNTRTGAGPC